MENKQGLFHATIVAGGAQARKKKGLELAQSLVCSGPNPPCGVCRDCRKAIHGIHPDIISVTQFMRKEDVGVAIKVDPIRALRNDTIIRPNEARSKVYLIEDAQNLNVNAQNALLKVLEEGPPYAAFVLLCDRVGALLETIRSRCTVELVEEDPEHAFSEAALGFARDISTGSELEWVKYLTAMELKKPDRQELDGFLSDVERLCQEAVLSSVTGQYPLPEMELLVQSLPRAKLLSLADAARQGLTMTAFHVPAGHLLGWFGMQLSL